MINNTENHFSNVQKYDEEQIRESQSLPGFPSELLLKIFNFLDTQSIMCARLTCKRFQVIADDRSIIGIIAERLNILLSPTGGHEEFLIIQGILRAISSNVFFRITAEPNLSIHLTHPKNILNTYRQALQRLPDSHPFIQKLKVRLGKTPEDFVLKKVLKEAFKQLPRGCCADVQQSLKNNHPYAFIYKSTSSDEVHYIPLMSDEALDRAIQEQTENFQKIGIFKDPAVQYGA